MLVSAGLVANYMWKQRQEQSLTTQVAGELGGASESPSAAALVSPEPLAAPMSHIHVAASLGAVPETPGPAVVPMTLTVTRSDGAALGDMLSARLDGDEHFRLGAEEWHTDDAGIAWEVVTQAEVDSLRRSGKLTWTVEVGEQVLDLPLMWQAGQGEVKEERVLEVDDVAPMESRPPN